MLLVPFILFLQIKYFAYSMQKLIHFVFLVTGREPKDYTFDDKLFTGDFKSCQHFPQKKKKEKKERGPMSSNLYFRC